MYRKAPRFIAPTGRSLTGMRMEILTLPCKMNRLPSSTCENKLYILKTEFIPTWNFQISNRNYSAVYVPWPKTNEPAIPGRIWGMKSCYVQPGFTNTTIKPEKTAIRWLLYWCLVMMKSSKAYCPTIKQTQYSGWRTLIAMTTGTTSAPILLKATTG